MANLYFFGSNRSKTVLYFILVLFATLIFSAFYAWLNYTNYKWLSPQFERNFTPTIWGIIQRLYLIIPLTAVILWRPAQIGFQVGKTLHYWRILLIILLLNVSVIAGYLILTGVTPYSGLNMLFNEVITVPLVEEIMWRGVVFAVLREVLSRFLPTDTGGITAAIFSGICFGLLHSSNALFGYPLVFVAIQTLNATIWGIVYGIVRAKTDSIYPPIVLHAAMNLVAVLA